MSVARVNKINKWKNFSAARNFGSVAHEKLLPEFLAAYTHLFIFTDIFTPATDFAQKEDLFVVFKESLSQK